MMNDAEKYLAQLTRNRRPVLLVSKGGSAERLALSYLRPCDTHLQGRYTGQVVSDAIDMCENTTLVMNLNLLSDDVAFNHIKALMDPHCGRPCGMVIAYINMEHTNLGLLPGQTKTLRDLHLETIFNHSIVIVVP